MQHIRHLALVAVALPIRDTDCQRQAVNIHLEISAVHQLRQRMHQHL